MRPVQRRHLQARAKTLKGVVQVTATVRNPAEPSKSWDGLFLVDTGSTDCVVPADALRSIGLVPKGRRTYELADGREETVDVTSADIEFMGDFVGTTVCFGPEGVEPILGLTALESRWHRGRPRGTAAQASALGADEAPVATSGCRLTLGAVLASEPLDVGVYAPRQRLQVIPAFEHRTPCVRPHGSWRVQRSGPPSKRSRLR